MNMSGGKNNKWKETIRKQGVKLKEEVKLVLEVIVATAGHLRAPY